MIGAAEDRGIFERIVLELDMLSFERGSYGSYFSDSARSIPKEDEERFEAERLETLLLYLKLIGRGSEYESTKESMQKRLAELMGAGKDARGKESEKLERSVREEIKASVEMELARAGDVFEPEFGGKDSYLAEIYKDEKKKVMVYYYVSPKSGEKEHEEGFYVYTPSGLKVVRASQTELGQGVLGVAYIGLGLIKILDSLYGLDYQEVLKHEVLHHQYPHESESSIRKMTMNELPFQTKYQ